MRIATPQELTVRSNDHLIFTLTILMFKVICVTQWALLPFYEYGYCSFSIRQIVVVQDAGEQLQ